ncbi:hypothetical protein MY4038_003942 [Beauveria bassiana]
MSTSISTTRASLAATTAASIVPVVNSTNLSSSAAANATTTTSPTVLVLPQLTTPGFRYTMFYDIEIYSISGPNCLKTTTLTPTAQTTPTANTTPTTTATGSASKTAASTAALAARNATIPTTVTPLVVTMLYPPWNIAWEKRDTSELSPAPPTVSVQFPVKTWEPGTEIDPSLTRKQPDPTALDKGLGQIIGIVAGCVAAGFAAISAISLWFCMRSRRREREAFYREEHQLQEQRLQRIGEYQRSRSPTDDEPLPVYVKSREQDKATGAGMAVPPYKERPSSESSRHSQQQDHQDSNARDGRNGMHQDTDGLTLHDQHTLETTRQQSGAQTRGEGNPRHER